MKITCSNCQKSYNINPTKIPAGIKSAKCKNCGHPMPLKAKAAVKPAAVRSITEAKDAVKSGAGTPVIKRSCLYCGQSHTLRRDKIPPDTATIKCKSCGRPVSLKLEEAPKTSLVHSLKKEASQPKAAGAPKEAGVQPPAVLTLTCASCNKRYKIQSHKIPPTAKSLKCRACGHRIKLPMPKVSPVEQISTPATISSTAGQSRRKLRLYALAASILLLVLVGAYAGLKLYKDRWEGPLSSGAKGQPAISSELLTHEPFLALNLNVPLILKNIDRRVEKDKKTLKFRTTMTLVKSLKLKRVDLFLYAGRQKQILPVILAWGSNAKHLEKIFARQESFEKFFERKSAGKYRFKQEALENTDNYRFSDEPYQMTLLDKGAVLAPVSVSGAIEADKNLLLSTAIAGFTESIADPQDLVRVAVRIPKGIQKGWEKEIQRNPALAKNPQAAMIAGMGSGILAQLTDSLKPGETMALGFRCNGENGRALSYAQQFRQGVDGNAVYQKLDSGDLQDVAVDGIIRALLELFQDDRYEHTLDFADNRLALEFSWSKKDDEAFLASLSKATIGQMFAQSIELAPTPGPIISEYKDDPHLFTTVDGKVLKPKIPRIIKQSLFPGHYWNYGENPQMTLELDPVDIPNAALAALTYEVRSIQSPDGKDLLRTEENKYKPSLSPGGEFPGNLTLSIKNGTPPESLGTARIQFMLSLPDALQIFEFKNGEEKGTLKKSGGIQVTLGRLEKDIADVTYTGGKSVRLIAYDKTGKALMPRESMSSSSSAAARFQGVIDTLKVIAATSMLEFPFEVEVDLNGGQELKLSRQPEIPERIRYNHLPVPTYSNFLESDLENLAVTWREAGDQGWTDNLEVHLAKGPFSGQADWEVHFFGQDQPRVLTGNAIQGARDISYRVEKGGLAGVSAAFGIVKLNIKSDITRLRFSKKDGGQPQTQQLPSGEPVSVSFNKNEISYGADKVQIIQVMAYDSFGKRLKQGNYSSSKGGNRKIYFWGQPTRFEMDLATKILTKKIEFEIKQRPLEAKAYRKYKDNIDNHRNIVSILKSIDRARRKDRSYYGDDLAGLYYLYGRKSKKPMRLFAKVIAHSDPAGQKRFGYKAKPYNGYYFTVLSGTEAKGLKKGYKRRSKKTKFVWKKGRVSTSALTRHPDLVAIPEDQSQPTFFLQWGQVFMKPLKGETLKYLPENHYKEGWAEAKFIAG